jgi:hypothetical protein
MACIAEAFEVQNLCSDTMIVFEKMMNDKIVYYSDLYTMAVHAYL